MPHPPRRHPLFIPFPLRFPTRTAVSLLATILTASTLWTSRAGGSPESTFPKPGKTFETSLVKPIVFSNPRLLVLHPGRHRIAVYDSKREPPLLIREIPVGLAPVSLAVRPGHPDEVWTVNALSDDLSVVDLTAGATVATIAIGDEPADLAFSRDGRRAFITVGGRDQLAIVDAEKKTVVKRVPLPGAAPRRVTLSPDGSQVLVSFFKSGNGTTILPHDHPLTPTTDPQVGLILHSTDPRSPVLIDDVDIVTLDVLTEELTSTGVKGVGTILFSHAFHPKSGRLYVTNTEARNTLRTLADLRGNFVTNRISIVSTEENSVSVQAVDLNLHLPTDRRPSPEERSASLAQPTDLVIHPETGEIYVAAYGSRRVGVIREDGRVVDRIPVGAGPRGLALDPVSHRLYCYNAIDLTITVIDLTKSRPRSDFPVGTPHPTSASWRRGREILFDARLSATGTVSCASCHIDGDRDGLAWDLSDPQGDVVPGPVPGIEFSPLKGPMVTQSLRGLAETGALHWRGDRPNLSSFRPAFEKLLGKPEPLLESALSDLEVYLDSLGWMPNPNAKSNRTLTRQAALGLVHFVEGDSYNSCTTCHRLPTGTKQHFVLSERIENLARNFKPAKLRGAYTKFGRFSKTGFGFGHEGAYPSIVDLLSTPRSASAPPLPLHWKHRLSHLVEEWDTGTAPVVGKQIAIGMKEARAPSTEEFFRMVSAEVRKGHCDLILHGTATGAGPQASLLYDPRRDRFESTSSSLGRITLQRILRAAARGRALLLAQAVPVGQGARFSIDRDGDLLRDGDEFATGTDPDDPDTDGDGFFDGWEVSGSSDPLRIDTVPPAAQTPRIVAVRIEPADPYPSLLFRPVISARKTLPGAVLLATDPGGTTSIFPLFPISPRDWLPSTGIPRERIGFGGSGWSFVVENPTGVRSSRHLKR